MVSAPSGPAQLRDARARTGQPGGLAANAQEGDGEAYDEELADRVRAVLPRSGAVTERQMFGGLAFMLDGHMFCGVVKDTLMVRLGPDAAGRALDQPHARTMDSPEGP